jgi:flagellar motility protein MotE (MotC chaperone)
MTLPRGQQAVAAQGPGDRISCAFLVLLAVAVAVFSMTAPVRSKDNWTPTVATASSDDVARRVAPSMPLPQWANPQLLNGLPKVKLRAPEPMPALPPSQITTGALPNASAFGARSSSAGRVDAVTIPIAAGAADASNVRPSPSQKPPAKLSTAGPPGGAGAGQGPASRPMQNKAEPAALGDPQGNVLPPDATAAQQYCFNTADSAADARYAWQAKKIKEMEGELEKRVAYLQAKTEEYKSWLAKRDEFARKAQEKLVGFYAKMKPDAAAMQFMAMEEDAAAALLMKLEPKVASLIMAEIEPTKAAKIAAIISGASRIPTERRKKGGTTAAPGGSTGAAAPQGRESATPSADASRS